MKQSCSSFHKCIATLKLTVWCINRTAHTTQNCIPMSNLLLHIYVLNSIVKCECILNSREIGMEMRDEKQSDLKIPTITFIHEGETDYCLFLTKNTLKLFTIHNYFSFPWTCVPILLITIITNKNEFSNVLLNEYFLLTMKYIERVWLKKNTESTKNLFHM